MTKYWSLYARALCSLEKKSSSTLAFQFLHLNHSCSAILHPPRASNVRSWPMTAMLGEREQGLVPPRVPTVRPRTFRTCLWESGPATSFSMLKVEDRVRVPVDQKDCVQAVGRPSNLDQCRHLFVGNITYVVDVQGILNALRGASRVDRVKVSSFSVVFEHDK